ncbi:TPM domain-containing protein [Rufibacter sp. LB8]|uniref:TPM domain-containing protein n=1 Tax=Rufibacter sp. LB8 TaxID=2777781 RepID=UPI00178C5FE9|nr:TPM domain-containing protein [Rufibacter sp. LB8]
MARDIITEADEAVITKAIEEAERNTSGEIRVHIEDTCDGEVLDRATQVFAYLHMHQTKLRNGVLFYVALKSHKFAVLGDGGINAVVPKNFWEEINQVVIADFKLGHYADGLKKGITMAGDQLKAYFPYAGDHKDINELPNDISFGSNLNKDQQT